MLKSSLIEILRTFNKEELSRFEDFVKSPFHNKSSNVVKLYAIVKKFAPAFTDEKLGKEKVYSKLFPGKPYNYGVMKNLIHDLAKLAEEYMKIDSYTRDSLRGDGELIKTLYERNLPKLLSGKFASFEKKYNEKKYRTSASRSMDYYTFLAEFHSMRAYITMVSAPDKNSESDLVLACEFSLYAGVLSILKSIPNYVSFRFGGAKYENINIVIEILKGLDVKTMKTFLDLVRHKSPEAYVLIRSYYLFSRAVISENDVNNYYEMKNYIFASADLFSKEDLKILVNCITVGLTQSRAIYTNEINPEKEILDLYDFNIERGSFTEDNGALRDALFVRYITHCCNLKNVPKAEAFLLRFSNLLETGTRENCINVAKAHISFAKGDFNEAQKYISKIEFSYFELKITIKCLQAMVFFESNNYESFVYLFDSMLHFSRNNKGKLPQKMENFKLFGEIVKNLYEIRNLIMIKDVNSAMSRLISLKKDIQNSYPHRKSWLLEKIKNLEAAI